MHEGGDSCLTTCWWIAGGTGSAPRRSAVSLAARRPGARTAPGLMLLVLAAACAGLCALYFHQSLTAPFNSDGAANVLQAQAIIHGNPLLRGWWTSDVSFYTTELPEYALVTAIHGVGRMWCTSAARSPTRSRCS